MWQRSEVNESLAYRVALCQHANGARSVSLSRLGSAALPPATVFLTQVVPTDLLLRRDFIGISESVRLETGEHFGVDAHGTWLTQKEVDALDKDTPFNQVPWLNGLRPVFAPR